MNGQLLNERIEVLHKIVAGTYEDYFDPITTQGQRGLFETVLGATIWYLPNGGDLFSGKISAVALNSLASNPEETKLMEEHSFPRKIGGRFLYEKFNLVLKSENNDLKKY